MEIFASQRSSNKPETSKQPSGYSGTESVLTRVRGPSSIVSDTARTLLLALLEWVLRLTRSLEKMRQTLTLGDGGARNKTRDPVYDIVDCGPRNRFCTPFAVAHNCLGLGYGCGVDKFIIVAKNMAGLDLSKDESKTTVYDFRNNNPGITNLWAQHQYALSVSADQKDSTHEIELASGRILTYFNPRRHIEKETGKSGFTVSFIKGAHPRHVYGGLLTENEIQATARDLLRDAWIKVHEAGFRVLFTVHDEFVFELPKETAEEDMKTIRSIVLSASPWAAGCPLDVEYSLVDVYSKA